MYIFKDNIVKVYISRDEDSDFIWLWKKPHKGNWRPSQLKDCETVNYQRLDNMDEWDTNDCYHINDFKKKFGSSIRQKTLRCVHLPNNLVESDDGKMFYINDNNRRNNDKLYRKDSIEKSNKR